MSAELISHWIQGIWKQSPGVLLGGPATTRSMLLLNVFRSHLTPEVQTKLQNCNCDLDVIPGGMTPVLQLCKVSVDKLLKLIFGTPAGWQSRP